MEFIALSYLFVIGACLWSFISVLVYRLKSGKTGIMNGRSECGSCGKRLWWKELFPIFSWAFQKGRCAGCKSAIPVVYPALELVTWALFVISAKYLADLPAALSGDVAEMWRIAFLLAVAFVTVTFVFYDILYQEIPDEVLVPATIGVWALLAFLPEWNSIFRHFEPVLWNDDLLRQGANALLWAVAIYTFFYLQFLIPAGIHCVKNRRFRDAFEVLAYYVLLPFAVVKDVLFRLFWKISAYQGQENEQEALPAWIGLWDLRIAVFMGFVAWAKMAGVAVFLAYIVWSVVGVYVLAVKKERNVAIAFWPFLAVWLYLSLFFYTPIMRAVLDIWAK